MSFVGGPFKYDVFISYCWGQKAVDSAFETNNFTRDWVKELVDSLVQQLRMACKTVPGSDDFTFFFDHRSERNSGADLDEELEEAVRSSAYMIVLMSPYYCESRWCNREVELFDAKIRDDGRPKEHFIIRQISRTEHRPPISSWPAPLLGKSGEPRKSGMPFYDPVTKTPLTTANEKQLVGLDLLKEAVEKLTSFRATVAATSAAPPKVTGKNHFVYLQRHADIQIWNSTKQALDTFVIVNPDEMDEAPKPGLISTFKERRMVGLADCHGLAIVRKSGDDPIRSMASAGSQDLEALESLEGIRLPWVLIDHVIDQPPDLPPQLNIPRVKVEGSEWPKKVVDALMTDVD